MKRQMSETIRLGILLAISGGFMDAYSYIVRDHVFANAQTGNMLLLGVYLAQGDWPLAFQYFLPVLCFALGIALAEIVRAYGKRLHWRQLAVLIEAAVLTCVALMPLKWNLIANSFTSFACGIQVESFRKIHGNSIATTMCIGNMRSGTQNLCQFVLTKEPMYARKSLLYYGIIAWFICGAIIGSFCIKLWAEKAILVSAGLLLLAFFIMFLEESGPNQSAG